MREVFLVQLHEDEIISEGGGAEQLEGVVRELRCRGICAAIACV